MKTIDDTPTMSITSVSLFLEKCYGSEIRHMNVVAPNNKGMAWHEAAMSNAMQVQCHCRRDVIECNERATRKPCVPG